MPDIKHFDPDAALERVERLFWQHGAATTSIQAVASATGLNRSSLYATYGDKQALFRASLRRYLRRRARPALRQLIEDGRGVPAVRDFFTRLIQARCSGEFAGWGCMIANTHVGAENGDPEIRAMLDEHYHQLREALHTALESARRHGQLSTDTPTEATADTLALLAYGVNLRSRAGAPADTLHRAVAAALAPLGRPGEGPPQPP